MAVKKQTNQPLANDKSHNRSGLCVVVSGTDWLKVTDDLVGVKIGDNKIDPLQLEDKVEAGTGYFKTSWNADRN